MPRRLPLLLLSLAPLRAWAAPEVAPAAPEQLAERLGETFVWEPIRRIGPRVRVASLDIQAGDSGAWLVLDEQGGAWLSEDGGAHWDNVLAPLGQDADDEDLSDDERVLLDAEALRDEAMDAGDDLFETAVDPVSGEEIDVAPDEDVSADAVAEAGATATLDASGTGDSGGAALPIGWFDPRDPSRALLAREDGTWRSEDGGSSWELVSPRAPDDPSVLNFTRAAEGDLVVAGTTDGVAFSVDGGASWIDVEDATDGNAVHQVVQEGPDLWAATSGGLYKSQDGLHWTPVPVAGAVDIRTVVPDPGWDGGFWVGSARALHRTDDSGQSFYVAGRQPVRGLRRIVHMPEPGHLFAISSDGVWESLDGGVSFTTADRQLDEPDVRSLAFYQGLPVVATPGNVWRMVAPKVVEGPARGKGAMLSLADSVRASIERPGMDINLLSLSRRGAYAALAPQLELSFDWDRGAGRDNDDVALSTSDSFDNDWQVGARICWGSCGATVVIESDAAGYDFETGDSLYAMDGKVFQEGEPVAAAANVAEHIRSYRRYLGEHVADAWLARQRLVAETAHVRTLPLREQVLHTLQLEELDARLDALTDGAFTRSLTRSEEPR